MIVVDASAMVEALTGQSADPDLLDALSGEISAPHLLDVEVFSALRGLSLGGQIEEAAADQARADFGALTISRYGVEPLADRVWALRHRFTSYDACYLALAEGLDVPLYTCDRKLDQGGHDADVRVVPCSR